MKHIFLFALVASLAAISSPGYAQDVGCGQNVYLEGGKVVIEPTNEDDTANIQCGFDAAIRENIKVVSLVSGNYLLSDGVEAASFFGTFEGVSKAATTVQVSERGISFAAGQQTIRYMTLVGENTTNANILVFTTSTNCESLTVRPTIDRVDFRAAGETTDFSKNAVAVRINPHYSCADDQAKIYGTFTINRSTFLGDLRAFEAYRVGGRAKILITDNEIDTNYGITVVPLTASVFVTNNKINVREESAAAVAVEGGDYQTKDVSVYLSGNRLSKSYDLPKLREGQFHRRYPMVRLGRWDTPYTDDKYTFNAVVSGNTFLIDEPRLGSDRPLPRFGRGDVDISFMDDGFIGGNRFTGCQNVAPDDGIRSAITVTGNGWSINSNDFPCTSTGKVYYIALSGKNNLVGAHEAYVEFNGGLGGGDGNISANDQ